MKSSLDGINKVLMFYNIFMTYTVSRMSAKVTVSFVSVKKRSNKAQMKWMLSIICNRMAYNNDKTHIINSSIIAPT